jgi:tetrapyrrole methylase family protein/MazG family protein
MGKKKDAVQGFKRLYSIIKKLRGKKGCAWDRKQDVESLSPSLIEEVFEYIDTVQERDYIHMREEIGDIFLLVTMLAYINQQDKNFTVADSLNEICDKLIRRHPHVFTQQKLDDPDKIIHQWNEIKKHTEGRISHPSALDGVPRTIPPLERSLNIQKKAAAEGFDWQDAEGVFDKFEEELRELRSAAEESASTGDKGILEDEIGDMFFTLVNLSRFYGIDPSAALHRCNRKFIKRFKFIEQTLKNENSSVASTGIEKLEAIWQESKKVEESR